jgi:isoleucyl-tRNA synthetase
MEQVMEAVTLARALRQERNLKVRQPLSSLVWVVPDPSTEDELAPFLQIIADELNVKTVKLRHDDRDLVTRSVTANFKSLGKRVGGKMQSVAKAVAALSDKQIQTIESGKAFQVDEFELTLDDMIIRRTERPGLALKSDGHMTVALDTEVTPELEAEGLAREVVHHIQNLRKQSGFEITDRITVEIATESKRLSEALETYRDYVCRETLAHDFEFKNVATGTTIDSNGNMMTVAIHRSSQLQETNDETEQ